MRRNNNDFLRQRKYAKQRRRDCHTTRDASVAKKADVIGLRGQAEEDKTKFVWRGNSGEETAAESRERGGEERATREETRGRDDKNKAGALLDRIEGDKDVIYASKDPFLCSPTRAMVEEGDAMDVWEMGSGVGKWEWEWWQREEGWFGWDVVSVS